VNQWLSKPDSNGTCPMCRDSGNLPEIIIEIE
jgi:hypothetical protein